MAGMILAKKFIFSISRSFPQNQSLFLRSSSSLTHKFSRATTFTASAKEKLAETGELTTVMSQKVKHKAAELKDIGCRSVADKAKQGSYKASESSAQNVMGKTKNMAGKTDQEANKEKQKHWKKPPEGWHVLSTDGSARKDLSGIGGLIRDQNGSIVKALAAGILSTAPILVIGVHGLRIPAHVIPHVVDINQSLHEVSIDRNFEDKLIWKPSKDGQFSVKSTYHALRQRRDVVDWAGLVWFKRRIPRHSFITWLGLRCALKTKAKLFAWRVSNSPNCTFCNLEFEAEHHMFGGCAFGGLIWHKLLSLMGFSRGRLNWDEEVKWCCSQFRGNDVISTIQKLVFCAFVSHIWAERNRRHHEGTILTSDQVFDLVVIDVKLRIASMNVNLLDSGLNRDFARRWNLDATFLAPEVVLCSWDRPEEGWHVLNTDGSLNHNRAGIGAIIRDHHGIVVGAATGSVVPSTITVHELEAVEVGLKLAMEKGVRKLIVATDSTTVVHLMKPRVNCPWHVVQLLRRIEARRVGFEEVVVKHVFREANQAADHLSKLLPTAEYLEVIESSFSEDLKKILYDDNSGCGCD